MIEHVVLLRFAFHAGPEAIAELGSAIEALAEKIDGVLVFDL